MSGRLLNLIGLRYLVRRALNFRDLRTADENGVIDEVIERGWITAVPGEDADVHHPIKYRIASSDREFINRLRALDAERRLAEADDGPDESPRYHTIQWGSPEFPWDGRQ